MNRFLFVGLAFVAAVLAVLFGWTWMYLIAGVLLVVAGVILLMQARKPVGDPRRSRSEVPPQTSDDLRAHGILEVRPKTRRSEEDVIGWSAPALPADVKKETFSKAPPPVAPEVKTPPLPKKDTPRKDATTSSAPVKAGPMPPRVSPLEEYDLPPAGKQPVAAKPPVKEEKTEVPAQSFAEFVAKPEGLIAPREKEAVSKKADQPDAATMVDEEPSEAEAALVSNAIKAQLEALKVTLNAHSVVMMMVDQEASTYRVEAAISDSEFIDQSRTFKFAHHFLSDLEPRTYVLQVGEDVGEEELTHYATSVPVGEVLISPVKLAGDMAGFLLCDRLKGAEEFSDDERFVAKEAAYLLGFMLDLHHGAKIMRWNPRLVPIRKQSVRQIIGEEMTEARRQGYPLGLALVFLDEGETIIRKGKEALTLVEQQLRSRLARTITNGRIEHFGQLGFGIFHYADVPEVQEWISTALDAFKEPDPILDGDLMIGVAMLQEKHQEPTDLQIAAGRALHEAYRTGESTIIVD